MKKLKRDLVYLAVVSVTTRFGNKLDVAFLARWLCIVENHP